MFTVKDQYFFILPLPQNPKNEKVNIMRGEIQMLNLALDDLKKSDIGRKGRKNFLRRWK